MPQYFNYPMVLNGIYIGMIGLRTDQQEYFNIPEPTAAELAAMQYRTSGADTQRSRFPDRLDSKTKVGTDIRVKRTSKTKNHAKDHVARGGKPIVIPTELKSSPPIANSTDASNTVIKRETIRTTRIKFPGAADMAEISAWIHLKCVAKKPKYIKTPGGRNYPVAPFAAGTVTGANTTV